MRTFMYHTHHTWKNENIITNRGACFTASELFCTCRVGLLITTVADFGYASRMYLEVPWAFFVTSQVEEIISS